MSIDDWKPRPRSTTVPYGYKIKEGGDPESQTIVEPELEIVELIEQALDGLDNGLSYREVANWLNNETNKIRPGYKTISHAGVRSIRQLMRPNYKKKINRVNPKKVRMTREERKLYRKKEKLKGEKISLAAVQKRILKKQKEIDDLKEELEPIQETQVIEEVPVQNKVDYSVLEEKEFDRPVIGQPNPGPQTDFLMATERQVLYGGAAGGGKSFALLLDPMRYFENPNFRGLLVRKTLKELGELKWQSRGLYTKAFPGAKFQKTDSTWVFPSGAELSMSYLEADEDVEQYQGQSFCWIGFDELTHWPTPFAWNYLATRLRTTDPKLQPYLSQRGTTNPGGPGHGWVKRMFVDPAAPGKAFPAQNEDGMELFVPYGDKDFPEERWGQPLFYRRFIPARLSDNPYLSEGGEYKTALLSQTENLKRQLLDGDWSVSDGAAFSEFRESIHVCEPFVIPPTWRRFRSCDWGYSTRQWTAVHYYAIAPDDTLYVYKELYFNQKTATEAARFILEHDRGQNISYGVLDANAWNKTGQSGPSIAEEMIRAGCRWRPADNKIAHTRAQGANRLHEVLRVRNVNGEEKPGIIFFNTCRKIISTLPILPSDPDGTDDIDQDFADDHAYDSIRYGVMSRPKFKSIWEDWDVPEQKAPIQYYKPLNNVFGY